MNDPAVVDDYALQQTAVLEPEASTPAPARRVVTARGRRGPEFYKPFHYILLIYLFFYCSRIPEMVPALHFGIMLQPLLVVGMIMTKSTKAVFQSDIGRAMTWFTGWILLCVPFAVWRGGAWDQFTLALQALALIFFMASFVRTIEDAYRVIFTMALAEAAVGVLSLVIGGGREGSNRLGLGSGNDTLSDANFLALFLVIGLPLIIFSASRKRGLMKVILILSLFPLLAGAAKTGSRSGLLTSGCRHVILPDLRFRQRTYCPYCRRHHLFRLCRSVAATRNSAAIHHLLQRLFGCRHRRLPTPLPQESSCWNEA